MTRRAILSCSCFLLAAQSGVAQVHPVAAQTWNTDQPVDALVSTAPGGFVDQSHVRPVVADPLPSILARTGAAPGLEAHP